MKTVFCLSAASFWIFSADPMSSNCSGLCLATAALQSIADKSSASLSTPFQSPLLLAMSFMRATGTPVCACSSSLSPFTPIMTGSKSRSITRLFHFTRRGTVHDVIFFFLLFLLLLLLKSIRRIVYRVSSSSSIVRNRLGCGFCGLAFLIIVAVRLVSLSRALLLLVSHQRIFCGSFGFRIIHFSFILLLGVNEYLFFFALG